MRDSRPSEKQVGDLSNARPNGRDPDFVMAPVFFAEDLAERYRCSVKAIRARASAGQLPTPMKLGKRLAWREEDVLDFETDRVRAARESRTVQVSITKYKYKGKEGLQAIWTMPHPCDNEKELKTTAVVPDQFKDRETAKAWATSQIGAVLPKLLGKMGESKPAQEKEEAPRKSVIQPVQEPAPAPRKNIPTFGDFVADRFTDEYLSQWKQSTQDSWEVLLRLHLIPFFGSHRLDDIDPDLIARFKGKLRCSPSTKNMRLAKLRVILQYANEIGILKEMPKIKRVKDPPSSKVIYTAEEIEKLMEAAKDLGPGYLVALLLAVDAGLRKGEIRSLRWEDIDLRAGTATIRRTEYRGKQQTPKGTIGSIALTRELLFALADLKKREPIGGLILYRRSWATDWEWQPHTDSSIDQVFDLIQTRAGVRRSGPHLLRHTSITRLAELGASAYELQAHARHARLTTTQAYLHQDEISRSRAAVDRLDAARAKSKKDPNETEGVAKTPSEAV